MFHLSCRGPGLTMLNAALTKKGIVMKINNKTNHLSRILTFFMMLLFVMGLSVNALFCSNYNLYELSDMTAAIETRANSECVVFNEGDGNTTCFRAFFSENNPHTEATAKNPCPIPMIAAIPNGFSLHLFLALVFLYFFSTLFRLLPDNWTLMNQKVRMND